MYIAEIELLLEHGRSIGMPLPSKRTLTDLLNEVDEEHSSYDQLRHAAHSNPPSPSSSRPRTKQRLEESELQPSINTSTIMSESKPESSKSQSQPQSLPYPKPSTARAPSKSTPFQQPTQLTSFSYDASHTLEFTDSALRYFVDPPRNAKLGYGYDRWVRHEDDRGRIDSLLQAFLKVKREGAGLEDVGVVGWRGVMTRCVGFSRPGIWGYPSCFHVLCLTVADVWLREDIDGAL